MPDVGSNVSVNWEAGDGIDLVFVEAEGEYVVVTVEATGGAGGGHTILESGTPLTDRAGLNFVNGLVASDDAANDETEVRADYGAVTAETTFGLASSNGAATSVSRSDHTHGTPADPVPAHTGDTSDAHDASAISFAPAGSIAATDVQAAIEEVASEAGGGGAPADADYLVGTANGTLSGEIVVGTTPGGELGGTWASPTVDATHSGSTHSAATDTHIADGTAAHAASAISIADAGGDFTATDVEGALDELQADNEAHVAAADPHTGYRLESADHTHQSTGAQAGTLDHGLALTGLTDDDHTIYLKEKASGGTAAEVPTHNHSAAGEAGTIDHGAITGLTDDDHTIYRKEADPVHLVTFTKTGNLSTGTGTTRWYNDTGANITLDSARGSVGTAPASQSILVDVNNNGTSVWNATQANRITIAAAGNTDEGGAFDDATIADGEYITVDIDQVGSGTVGADLTVSIWGHYSL